LHCCNLSSGVELIVWFTTNGMHAKNNNIYAWREQAVIREIATRSLLLLAAAVRSFAHMPLIISDRNKQNGAVTRMWRPCRVQPSHKERAIGVVRCKKEGLLWQPLRWCFVDCVIHHERDARQEQKYICVAWASNNKRDCDAWSLLSKGQFMKEVCWYVVHESLCVYCSDSVLIWIFFISYDVVVLVLLNVDQICGFST